jgi:hypothetical protein
MLGSWEVGLTKAWCPQDMHQLIRGTVPMVEAVRREFRVQILNPRYIYTYSYVYKEPTPQSFYFLSRKFRR